MSGSTEQAIERTGAAQGLVLDRGVLPTTEVIARVHRIQDVMKALMKEGTHYGTIPGTPKPTLYKPGAELVLMTFRIAASPSLIEDLSTPDEIRYRVTVRGTNQVSGDVLGELSGECSSNEEKYRWRAPVCDEEFNETPEDRRRMKWKKGYQGAAASQLKQVRTSPADVANTILKMATKRALIAMTLVTTGCSDIFAQDLEDLAEELRESIGGDDAPKTPATPPPQRRSQTGTPAPTPQPLPPDALIVVGKVEKVEKPEGKTYFLIRIKGDKRYFSTFSDTLAKDAKVFAGTDHAVKLAYTETTKSGRTFTNAVGISIADAEPAKPPLAGPAFEAPDVDEIFGGDREPGSEG